MRLPVRLWQTALFVTVIIVAMLVLSTTLFGSLERSMRGLSSDELFKDSAELAVVLHDDAARGALDKARVAGHVARFVGISKLSAWVYDANGMIVDQQVRAVPPAALLEAARKAALAGGRFSRVDYAGRGVGVASGPILDGRGRIAGAVVVGSRDSVAAAILAGARSQLAIAFWVALAVSGLLGFVFSEIIARQTRRLSQAALAIAGGDFGQRLKRGPVPDEIADLAESFNRMAENLGEAFSAIQGQERELTAVVESMAEGIIAVDQGRVIRLANPVAARMLRVKPTRLAGRRVEEVVRGEELLAPIDQALSGRQVSETVDFGRRVLALHGTPFASADGTGGAVLLLRDITEQRRWEDAQRDFIANASHEMRTPIAALKGFLELLEGGAKRRPEVLDEFLRTMQGEVDRLQRLVSDLFMLAQLDSGRLELDIRPESLEEIIGDVISVIGPLADEAGVRVLTKVPPGRWNVLCDRDRVVQVLLGFMENALKYVPRGGSATVWVRPDGPRVRVGVRDTGPGIARNAVDKVFDRFYRASEGDAARRAGTGLGLSIAKEIVEAHNSRIVIESEPGKGSDFSFALRRAEE
jgi:PAS domain S-box-containing protein